MHSHKRFAIVTIAVAAGLVGLPAGTVRAERYIIQPVGATANSQYQDSGGPRHAEHVITGATEGSDPDGFTDLLDGYDLTTGAAPVPNNPNGTSAYNAHHKYHGPSMWLTNAVIPGIITFDLGAVYRVDGIVIWNHNAAGLVSRGMRAIEIEVSENGTDWDPAGGDVPAELPQATGLTTYRGNVYSFSGGWDGGIPAELPSSPMAQYVRITGTTSWGDAYIGLSEVRFTGEIPEPGTFALLCLGSAMLAIRRRRAVR